MVQCYCPIPPELGQILSDPIISAMGGNDILDNKKLCQLYRDLSLSTYLSIEQILKIARYMAQLLKFCART